MKQVLYISHDSDTAKYVELVLKKVEIKVYTTDVTDDLPSLIKEMSPSLILIDVSLLNRYQHLLIRSNVSIYGIGKTEENDLLQGTIVLPISPQELQQKVLEIVK